VSSKDRIRQSGSRVTAGGKRIAGRSGNWDGLRLAVPAGLDLGDVRHNLGYLYWKQQDWARCVKVLAPFLEEEALRKGRSGPKALYMAAQSCFRMCDYAGGMKFLRPLLRDFPNFEAVEEAHVYAARGCVETAQWAELDHLCRRFAESWPQSSHRPHMDLYAALGMVAQGKADGGMARLKSLAAADTLEDVKADAGYHVGRLMLADEKAANYAEALKYLDQSVALYPREGALLASARCAMKLRQPEKAKAALDRLLREFAGGDPKVVAEAKALVGEVNKQIPPKG
jgi:tetratricopeptide (TPR) repeat protein